MSYHSSKKRRVYLALPYPFKCALASYYGLRQRRSRFGRFFAEAQRELEESQTWPPDRIAAYQTATLKGFLADAVNHTAFYRDRAEYRYRSILTELPDSG